jgi:hypothetical protein
MFWAEYPLGGCILDISIGEEEESLHFPDPVAEQRRILDSETTSLHMTYERLSNKCGTTRLLSCEEPRLCRWGIRSGRCRYRDGCGWQCRALWIWKAGVFANEAASAAM